MSNNKKCLIGDAGKYFSKHFLMIKIVKDPLLSWLFWLDLLTEWSMMSIDKEVSQLNATIQTLDARPSKSLPTTSPST